jgi:hypothetical protein
VRMRVRLMAVYGSRSSLKNEAPRASPKAYGPG